MGDMSELMVTRVHGRLCCGGKRHDERAEW